MRAFEPLLDFLVTSILFSGFIIFLGFDTRSFFGTLILTNITGNTWIGSGSGYTTGSGTSNGSHGGEKTLSGKLDRIQIIDEDETDIFDDGIATIMWM